MAFSLVAYDTDANYSNGYVVNMTAGTPYSLESFEDGGPADVARFSQSSPDQHGVTDLGFRLQPRVFVAKIHFVDGDDVSGGAFGDNREWLFSVFRPSHDLYLRLTRDDGEVRILRCHTQQIEIELIPEHYPARLNRAVITLRAASPLWYTAAAKTATYARSTSWPTAGTLIPSANVKEYGNYPTQGQAWTFANPNTAVNAWSIVIRSGSVAPAAGTATVAAYNAGTGLITELANTNARIFTTGGAFYMGTGYAFAGSAAMTAGTHNYIQTHDGTTWRNYRGTVLEAEATQDIDLKGTGRRWRAVAGGATTTYWPEELPYVAIYDIELDAAQRAALDAAITADLAEAGGGTITTVNLGDVTEYPLITVRGPMVNPVFTNLATGDVMDFTGITVSGNTTLTVDLRSGAKSATVAGSTLMGSMGTPAQLASWGLAPAPIAGGGTNLISVTGGSITSDTLVTVTYYDRHVSF